MTDDVYELYTSVPRTAKYLRSLPLEERMKLKVPPAYREASLEESTYPATDAVRGYVEQYGGPKVPAGTGLLLVGPDDRAKSTLAAGALRQLVRDKGVSGTWCSTRMYLDMTMAQYSEGGLAAAGYKDRHVLVYIRYRYDVVVLDGLGDERRTPQSDSIIYELLRDRHDWLLPTIITTSLTLPKIEKRYGEHAAAFIERTTLEVPVGRE